MKQIGLLTGGGDAPGLNAVIRAAVLKAITLGYSALGIKRGWAGLMDRVEAVPLKADDVDGIHMTGGTIIGTSRTNPMKFPDGPQKVLGNLKALECDALIAIGGEDTLGVAHKLFQKGCKVVGVPKTIDNDLSATDYTFGFDTAINIATECLDRLHTTTKSHERVMVVEIMGRHAGWLALHSGIAGGAHVILLPEEKFDIEEICKVLVKRREQGKLYSIVAASEGALPREERDLTLQTDQLDEFGHVRLGGIGKRLAEIIEKKTGIESRHVVLGHLQRGGAPSAFDRVLATRFGLKAVELVHQKAFGKMVSLRGTGIVSVDLSEAVGQLKVVDPERIEEARLLFGY